MDLDDRLKLVNRGTQEIVTEDELRDLLEREDHPTAYWGFEISGPIHLGMGLICGRKIRDFVEAGLDFTVYLADIHSMINRKFGGDLEMIQKAGEYFKHGFRALGLGEDRVRFLFATELAEEYGYWDTVVQVARNATVRRITRALPIMGREMASEDVEAAFLFYPCMQVADIFRMDLDVACAGIDQRKAHMLARDVADKLGAKKPVSIHTPLLMSLSPTTATASLDEDTSISAQISAKMSKSLPEGAVYIHDSPEEIREKIKNAFCPPRRTEGNPIVQLAEQIIFPEVGELTVDRKEKYGGPLTLRNREELNEAYTTGDLHPLDLKRGVAEHLVEILEPVRRYFDRNPEPLEEMKELAVSR